MACKTVGGLREEGFVRKWWAETSKERRGVLSYQTVELVQHGEGVYLGLLWVVVDGLARGHVKPSWVGHADEAGAD